MITVMIIMIRVRGKKKSIIEWNDELKKFVVINNFCRVISFIYIRKRWFTIKNRAFILPLTTLAQICFVFFREKKNLSEIVKSAACLYCTGVHILTKWQCLVLFTSNYSICANRALVQIHFEHNACVFLIDWMGWLEHSFWDCTRAF